MGAFLRFDVDVLIMGLKKKLNRDVTDVDFPDVEITRELRDDILKGKQVISGDMRIAMGKFYTDKEWESRRKKVLSRPLP
jgi:hypothetical protein